MTRSVFPCGLAILLLATLAPSPSRAAFIIAGQTTFTGNAIQDIELLPGTPFNPTTSSIFIHGLTAFGTFTLDRQAQSGSTIVVTGNNSLFAGTDPLLGAFKLGSGPPLGIGSFGGTITNVVQNPADSGFATGQPSSFASGTLNLTGTSFGLLLANGVTVFTDPAVPFSFTATLDGLPPSPGTVLSNPGTDTLDVLFTDPTTGRNIVVAHSSNRRIVEAAPVPEPSSLLLLGAGGVGLCCYCRRGQRRAGTRNLFSDSR